MTKQQAEAKIRAAFAAVVEHIKSDPNDDLDRKCDLEIAALNTAKELSGWDFEADKDFADWALHATDEELYPENLRRALAALDERYPEPGSSV